MNQELKPATAQIVFGAILGGSLIASALIAANTAYTIKNLDNTLSVVGSATTHVTSDSVKWTMGFSRTVQPQGVKNGYAQMQNDLSFILAFLKSKGIPDDAVTTSPVSLQQEYSYKSTGDVSQQWYALRQTITVQSGDVRNVTALAKSTKDITDQGILFSTFSLEYYYTKLADVRVALLSDALRDARARADKIAQNSGRGVGSLKSAAMGVVQVLSPNSIDVSDYGAYDTSSIEKVVMVPVKATFTLK